VVSVQVRHDDRVDLGRVDVALQRPESTVPEIEHKPVPVGLEQISGCRRVGPGHAA
jgi:hypothetical protein